MGADFNMHVRCDICGEERRIAKWYYETKWELKDEPDAGFGAWLQKHGRCGTASDPVMHFSLVG